MALPRTDAEYNAVLQNIAAKLGGYRVALGLSTGDVTRAVNNAAVFDYILTTSELLDTASTQFYGWKRAILTGEPSAPAPPAPDFALPSLPVTVTVAAGIRKWTDNLVLRIKGADAYTEDIGLDLDISDQSKHGGGGGGVHGGNIGETLNPTLKPHALPTDTVEINWNKQGQAAVRTERRRAGETAWTAIGDAISSPFIDTTPSTGGNPEKREYRAIYIKQNNPFGQYSDIVTVYTTP